MTLVSHTRRLRLSRADLPNRAENVRLQQDYQVLTHYVAPSFD